MAIASLPRESVPFQSGWQPEGHALSRYHVRWYLATRCSDCWRPRTVKVTGCPTISGVVSSAAQTAIRVACQQVGDPYVRGANGPDAFDCSGLTQYAYKAAGISLTHFTGAQ